MADLQKSTGDQHGTSEAPSEERGTEPVSKRAKFESSLVRFAREYGWRAYAIPVLAVITIFVVADVVRTPAEEAAEANPAAESTTVADAQEPEESRGPGPDPSRSQPAEIDISKLPEGGPFTEQGNGSYRIVGEPGMSAGQGETLSTTYVIEIENGVDTTTYGGDGAFARMVDATLADPRGWTNDPNFRFEHVAADQNPDMRIQLSSVNTTAELCGADLEMETSCRTTLGGGNIVVLNEARWVRGAAPFEGDLGAYRQYLINHEVGHGIGYADHVPCSEDGALAPIMMQQTLSLNNTELNTISPNEVYADDGNTCRANAWPFPNP
ncbi:DUF3152 domain-containing protein [Corynebacterium lubricantis]|uniref:DUF3152 domain-containing protein n=1 Tax=Corynebacterium lubricantis TaxID=541095 RepID=UPI000365048B|nr:DUF3152 domain-containing protein [Corynebacterium lubricantis]